MADRPPYPDSDGDTRTPRWVKVFAIIALVLVLLVVIMMFIGDGDHGPGRHRRSGGQTPPSSVMAHGVQQP